MKKTAFVLLWLLTGGIVLACGKSDVDRDTQATQIAAEIFATQTAQAPTSANTPTTATTNTPTNTPTPTPTPTATVTPIPTSTPAPGPTLPPPATSTPQLIPTPTGTTSAGPALVFFRANVEEADPGDTIVLEWESVGATKAVLYHVPASGQLPQSGWEVDATGYYTYKIDPGERNVSQFYLVVLDQAERYASAYLTVALRCPDPWFFSPAPDVCPTAPVSSNAAEQHFERGVMIWVEQEDWIYVLYGDDQFSPKWAAFTDEWDEGEPDQDPSLVPPSGLYQPKRGFGLVWRQHPEVRERLGWAIDQEIGFGTVVQRTTLPKYNSTYVRALDGNVWHLGPERSSWEKIRIAQ